MPQTQLRGPQILDGSVQRQDLDVATAGSAVIRKIIAGTNVTISSTGVDAGTGDVTINASGATPGGSNTQIQYNNAGAFAGASITTDGTNLTFPTGAKITGDFSNGAIVSRVAFQSSTTNGATSLTIIPNGTSTISSFGVFNNSTPTNSSYGAIVANGATDVQLQSAALGTGTFLPLNIQTQGATQVQIPAGVVAVNNLTLQGSTTGNPVIVGVGGSDANASIRLSPKGTGNVQVNSGNLVFNTTGQRITGDFGNATVSSRIMFQSSVANGSTAISAIPNGTNVTAALTAFNAANPDAASFISAVVNGTGAFINSGQTGAASFLPLNFQTSNTIQAQVLTGVTAVNYLTLQGSLAGNAVTLGAAGADANIPITLTPKGTGTVNVPSLTCSGNVTGTWNGNTIGVAKGGTGLTAFGTAGQVLRVNATETALEYATVSGGGGGSLTDGDYGDVVVSGTGTILTVDGVTGAYAIKGAITPAQLTANTNDYAPTGFATATVINLSSNADTVTITGLAGGSAGRMVKLFNTGSNDIVLTDQDTASAAANRFNFGGSDQMLTPGGSIELLYSGTTSTWDVVVVTGDDVSRQALRRQPFHYNDFFSTAPAPWAGTAVSSGTSAQNTTNVNKNHPGVVRITSSTTANSGVRISTDVNCLQIGGGELFELVFLPLTFTNTTVRFGFHSTTSSAAPVDGVYFELLASANITGVTASNSTRTTSATIATLTAGTWYRALVRVNRAKTSVTFFIYSMTGVLLGSQTVTTNIPALGRFMGSGVIATNSGTVATALVDLDYIAMKLGDGLILAR